MSKHTPGPWNAIVYGVAGPRATVGDGIFLPAIVPDRSDAEARANAELAAAAPDLLRCAHDLENILSNNAHMTRYEREALERAKAAICKAEGYADPKATTRKLKPPGVAR